MLVLMQALQEMIVIYYGIAMRITYSYGNKWLVKSELTEAERPFQLSD
jgi:hypothetical protein